MATLIIVKDQDSDEFKIFKKIKNVIYNKTYRISNIDSNLADLGFDSLSLMDFVITIEKIYKIKISDLEVENFKVVKDIVSLIKNKLKEKIGETLNSIEDVLNAAKEETLKKIYIPKNIGEKYRFTIKKKRALVVRK